MTKTRWLSEAEQKTWRGYMRMHAELSARIARRLQLKAGLSAADYEVLVNLSEAPEQRMRAFELSRAVQWEKSRLSHQLTRMQGRGLVTRKGCDTDRRGAFVVLTTSGRTAIEAAAGQHMADVRSYFIDALSSVQRKQLDGITAAVRARLAADAECHPPGNLM